MKKKNQTKKAALIASAIMLTGVGTVIGNTSAQAASTPAYKTNLTKVYYGKSTTYTAKLKSLTAGQTVKFAAIGEGKNYISLSAKKVKVKSSTAAVTFSVKKSAVTNNMGGKPVKLRARVFDSSGNLIATLKDKMTIAVDATGVTINTDKFDVNNMVTGGSYDFDRILLPATSANKTYWQITNASGADYSSEITGQGVWTPSTAGSYQITAITKRSKTAAKVRATASINVTVKAPDETVTPDNPNTPDTPDIPNTPSDVVTPPAIDIDKPNQPTTPDNNTGSGTGSSSDINKISPMAVLAKLTTQASIVKEPVTTAAITSATSVVIETPVVVQVTYNKPVSVVTPNAIAGYTLNCGGKMLTASDIRTTSSSNILEVTFIHSTEATKGTAQEVIDKLSFTGAILKTSSDADVKDSVGNKQAAVEITVS